MTNKKELPLSLKAILENSQQVVPLDAFFKFELDGRFEFCPPDADCFLLGYFLKGEESFSACDPCLKAYIEEFNISEEDKEKLYNYFSPSLKARKNKDQFDVSFDEENDL
jgi:hypothetical protein